MNTDLMLKVHMLKKILKEYNIDLDRSWPNFVVLGDQSVGKSSMLEMVLQLELFPRGDQRVTTWPIVVTTFYRAGQDTPRIVIEGKGLEYTDVHEARDKITDMMRSIKQNNGGVSSDPIRVAVYSSKVVDLTFVDIPGLIATTNYGEALKTGIEDLAREYWANKNYIILACYCAATDPDTSTALSIAKQYDPCGDRTFGILTKCDGRIDGGSLELLKDPFSTQHPLKYGYCGTIGRDTNDRHMSIEKAIKREIQFFKNSPELKDKAHLFGTQNLRNRLSQILIEKTIKVLPEINSELETKKYDWFKRRKQMQNEMGFKEGENETDAIYDLIQSFDSTFKEHMKGRDYSWIGSEITGEAKFLAIIQEGFDKHVSAINPLEKLDDMKILRYIRQTAGYDGSMFPTERGARAILGETMPQLVKPCRDIIDEIKEKLIMSIYKVSKNGKLKDYYAFNKFVGDWMKDLVEENYNELMRTVENYVSAEKYINFEHANFKMVMQLLSMTRNSINRDEWQKWQILLKEYLRLDEKTFTTFFDTDQSIDEFWVIPSQDPAPDQRDENSGDLEEKDDTEEEDSKGNSADDDESTRSTFGNGGLSEPNLAEGDRPNAKKKKGKSKKEEKKIKKAKEVIKSDPSEIKEIIYPQEINIKKADFKGEFKEKVTDEDIYNSYYSNMYRQMTVLTTPSNIPGMRISRLDGGLGLQDIYSEQEAIEINGTKRIINCYFAIMIPQLQDMIKKQIHNFFIVQVLNHTQTHLVKMLSRYSNNKRDLLNTKVDYREAIIKETRLIDGFEKAIESVEDINLELNRFNEKQLMNEPIEESKYFFEDNADEHQIKGHNPSFKRERSMKLSHDSFDDVHDENPSELEKSYYPGSNMNKE